MPKTVLIVDDLDSSLAVHSLMLSRGGYKTLTAPNAHAALELLEESTPDLIICDNNMPGMDGYEFCRLIRQREDTRHIPFVMLIYTSLAEVQDKALEAGVDEIWTLPMRYEKLTSKVASILAQ